MSDPTTSAPDALPWSVQEADVRASIDICRKWTSPSSVNVSDRAASALADWADVLLSRIADQQSRYDRLADAARAVVLRATRPCPLEDWQAAVIKLRDILTAP